MLTAILLSPPLNAQNPEIWEIQGSGNTSPLLGQTVTINANVVTAVGEDFFFVQTPPERSDNNPNTSDGLFIFTGSPPNLNISDLVNVTGDVLEFDDMTELSGSGLTFQTTGETAPLPPAVTFTTTFPGTTAALVRDLEYVEGMRVTFDADVIAPAAFGEIAALSTAAQRPLREAGIEYPGITNLPVWDGNPEIFWIDPDALNQPNNRFLSVGQTISAEAVLFQADNIYLTFPTSYTVGGTVNERDLPPAASDEITIGCINVLLLREESDLLTTQFAKLSRYIVDRLGTPDIVALQEVDNLDILQQLNFAIGQLNPDADYTPYLIQGNNNTSINCAYLISDRIQNVEVRQLGAIETLSIGGRLHDRPPLLLEAELPTDPPTPIQVLNLHLRSLSGIEGDNSFFVRTKRYEQSLSVAEMIQARQGENLFVVGDFNALPFSDGYVDVLSQLTGTTSLGAEYEVTNTVDPPLTNYAFDNTAEERYSFVFRGSGQLIDHCLSTDLTDLTVTDFAFARGNCDAASAYYVNPNLTTRSSDHDGFVLYVRPDAPIVSSTDDIIDLYPDWVVPNPVRAGTRIALPENSELANLKLFDVQGRIVRSWPGAWRTSVTIPSVPAGMYLLVADGGSRRVLVQD